MLALLLTGCAVGPNFRTPAPPSVDRYSPAPLPASTTAAPAQRFDLGAPVAERWWTLFGSTRLDALEDEALEANADLAAAQAALRQAHELYVAQRAAQYPSVDLALGAQGARNSETIAPPLANNAVVYSLYTAQLNVSYLPDVFGGLRRQTEAAAAQAENQRFMTQAVYLTLTVNVANAFVQLASLQSQLDNTLAVIRADRAALQVTDRRRREGEAPTADVAGARSTLAQAEQLAPPLRKQIAQQRDLLATLVGRPPSQAPLDKVELADLTLPADLPVSLPSQLVRQRPDVRAAEANFHAASAQVGVAAAARLPNFTITGGAGGASTTVGTLLTNGNALWAIGAGLTQPVFDAGALRHKEKAARAALEQSGAQYRSAVLGALQNTADVLQAIVADAETLQQADAAAGAAAHALRLARDAFAQGEANALSVLSAEAAEGQARITLSQASGARYVDTIALYQALGGGWRERQ